MRLITLYLPEPYIRQLDDLVTLKRIPNRAEGIRLAVRDFLSQERYAVLRKGERGQRA